MNYVYCLAKDYYTRGENISIMIRCRILSQCDITLTAVFWYLRSLNIQISKLWSVWISWSQQSFKPVIFKLGSWDQYSFLDRFKEVPCI